MNPVIVNTADGEMDVYRISPDASHRVLVILNTDIRGVRPVFIEYAHRLANAGFDVVIPNLYYRIARPPVIDMQWTFFEKRSQERFQTLLSSLSHDGLRRDHQALIDTFSHPEQAVAIIGYCMSGAIALRMAAAFPDRIQAALSFHGGHLVTPGDDSPHLCASRIRAHVYTAHAREDVWMPASDIDILESEFQRAGLAHTSERYEGLHGFAVADSPNYHEPSADRHWQAIFNLLLRLRTYHAG